MNDEPLAYVEQHTESAAERRWWLAVVPSGMSLVLCLVGVLGIVGAAVGAQLYAGSSVQYQVIAWRAPSTPEAAYQALFDAEYGTNTYQAVAGSIMTGVFWSFLALLVYGIIYGIYGTLHAIRQLREETEYVNADRAKPVRTALLHLGVRCVVLVAWAAYMLLFLKVVVPGVVAQASLAAIDLLSPQNIGRLLAAAVVLFAALHVHIVLLRLSLLRSRALGE